MTELDVGNFSIGQLLEAHARVLDELRERKVVRSNNNPVSDFAEIAFCKAFPAWTRQGNSNAGYDAFDGETLYQIKARRIHRFNRSRQLSAIRKLDARPFHFLAALLFNESYGVHRAALIPVDVVIELSKHVEHTNSWKFLLKDDVWECAGVQDVTDHLRHVVDDLRGEMLLDSKASAGTRRSIGTK